VPALADQLGRLIGALHDDSPKPFERRPCCPFPCTHTGGCACVGRPVESGALYGRLPPTSISA
jgi:hypothetical protein